MEPGKANKTGMEIFFMIFEKRRRQQIREDLEAVVKNVFEKQNQKQTTLQAKQEAHFDESMEKSQKMIRRLSDTMEDFLDTYQEENEALCQVQKQIEDIKRQEQKLLGLIGLYQEHIELVEEWIAEHMPAGSEGAQEAWRQQHQILKEKLVTEGRFCMIDSIGMPGEMVDYRLHEVIEAIEADKEEQGGKVAKIFRQGMIYQGKVIKKARVQAYKKG